MIKNIGIIPLLLTAILISLNAFAEDKSHKIYEKGQIFQSAYENLELVEKGGQFIEHLYKHQALIYLGEKSNQARQATLDGKRVRGLAYKVKTMSDKVGWVIEQGVYELPINEGYTLEDASLCIETPVFEGVPPAPYLRVFDGKFQLSSDKILQRLERFSTVESVYARSLYEDACTGGGSEYCYANRTFVQYTGERDIYSFFGDFEEILGVTKGMASEKVLQLLGTPDVMNSRWIVYTARGIEYIKEAYPVDVLFKIKFLISEKGMVSAVKIEKTGDFYGC